MAEIVRQETDGGRRIVQFYIAVADGSLDGFRDHHRMSAARRLDKIAPGLVAEYLLKYASSQSRDSLRGRRLPLVRRSPITRKQPERKEHQDRGPNIFRRRLAQFVREETGDGRAIVEFIADVMHGAITGFKPHHRLEAAKELASYLTPNDDSSPVIPAKAGTHPIPAPAQSLPRTRYGAGTHPIPLGAASAEPDSIVVPASLAVIPANAGTHPVPVGAARAEPDSTVVPASIAVIPANAGTHPIPAPAQSLPRTRHGAGTQRSGAGRGSHPNPVRTKPAKEAGLQLETHNQKPKTKNPPQFARDEITGAIYAFDALGPFVVDEDGVTHRISPDRIAGYRRASRAHEHRTRTGKTARTRNRRRKNPNAPTPSSKPKTKNPPPSSPLSSSTPGRSPPRIWV